MFISILIKFELQFCYRNLKILIMYQNTFYKLMWSSIELYVYCSFVTEGKQLSDSNVNLAQSSSTGLIIGNAFLIGEQTHDVWWWMFICVALKCTALSMYSSMSLFRILSHTPWNKWNIISYHGTPHFRYIPAITQSNSSQQCITFLSPTQYCKYALYM